MSTTKWTEAQRTAIDYRGQDLLLSAAAGSGKTATLTERIVRLLTDGDSGAEISRMLCVTFTRAAAAELRERIGRALREALAADRTNARLSRQLYDLGRAPITTIHSFCLSLLRPHAAELGLPAGFSVASEGDVRALSRQVMTDILTEEYETGDEAFFRLADTLGGARDEGSLDEVMLSLADTLTARGVSPEGLCSLADQMAGAEGFFSTALGAGSRSAILRFAQHYARYFRRIAEDFREDERFAKAYLPAALACAETADAIITAASAGAYPGVREAVQTFAPPARLGTVKTEFQTEEVLYFKEQYADFKEEIGTLRTRDLAMTEEDTLLAAVRTADISRTAAGVLHRYFAELGRRKRERGVVDFGDLEELTARILVAPDGTPTDAARSAGETFDYIFIDEYQDTNHTQDAIFAALAASGGRRFMVGDIKQSIYRFRGAEPEVFAAYRRMWPTEGPSDARSLFMGENFRCDRTVVDFVNLVSRHLFSAGSIPFTPEDELRYAKPQEADYRPTPAEVCLLPSAGEDVQAVEAEFTAARISAMLGRVRRGDGVPLRPKDIAILLRSPGADGEAYRAALARRGIPVQNQTASSLFEEPEVILMLSILRTIDNPTRDIDLAGAMKSPVFRFRLDDLVAIRHLSPDSSLWEAVRAAAAAEGEDDLALRCRAFVGRLTALRQDARGMAADALLLRLYEETDIAHLAESDPERDTAAVRDNLRSLYEMSRRFEAGGQGGGLYRFLLSVKEAADEGTDKPESTDDAVQILSIHHSKGLEFPVCFLGRAAKKPNRRDLSAALLFDPAIGAVMRLPDEGGTVMCDTPLRRSVAATIEDAMMEEEMRVLYVALTRARERLIVTAAHADPEKLLNTARLAAEHHTAYSVFAAPSYLHWILDALEVARQRGEVTDCVRVQIVEEQEEALPLIPSEPPTDAVTPQETTVEYESLFRSRFDFRYPHAHLAGIPAKLTVSRLAPDILDPEEEVRTELSREPRSAVMDESQRNRAPRFLSGKTELEASFAGIATHMFLQFCDFERLSEQGGAAELDRLHVEGYLTDAHAEAVRMEEIEAFRRSALLARIRRAAVVKREFRFNAALQAAELTTDPALAQALRATSTDVIVQGVVDCLFIEPDGRAVLLDYKTDRLTRAERDNPALAARKLIAAHAHQLRYYRAVCAAMLHREVEECLIYSLPLGGTVEVPT